MWRCLLAALAVGSPTWLQHCADATPRVPVTSAAAGILEGAAIDSRLPLNLTITNYLQVLDGASPRGQNHIWVVEYKSDLCTTCQEFEPEYRAVVAKLRGPRLSFASCVIDEEDGMELAVQEGALDEGVPAVYVYEYSRGAGHHHPLQRRTVVTTGVVVPRGDLERMILEAVHEVDRDDEGVR